MKQLSGNYEATFTEVPTSIQVTVLFMSSQISSRGLQYPKEFVVLGLTHWHHPPSQEAWKEAGTHEEWVQRWDRDLENRQVVGGRAVG